MSLFSVNESNSKYLFGKEADEVFGLGMDILQTKIENAKLFNLNASDLTQKMEKFQEKSDAINHYLDLLMRVNVYLLSKKDAFCLINPNALNNQCHLYSLMALKMRREYINKTDEEKSARTEENRFLHLSVFLNFAFLNDQKLAIEAISQSLEKVEENTKKIKRQFESFLRDNYKKIEEFSRFALNGLFENNLKHTLCVLSNQHKDDEDGPLYEELHRISLKELNLQPISGKNKKTLLYTYPKLSGVLYFSKMVAEKDIPLVFRIKVITKDGVATLIETTRKIKKEDEPVIVFEGVVTDGSRSVAECREQATECPKTLYRSNEIIRRHVESTDCFLCKKGSVDLSHYRENLKKVMEQPYAVLSSLGADFILKQQGNFRVYFDKNEDFPLLSQVFQESVPNIDKFGVDMNRPKTFSVFTVHVDQAKHAQSAALHPYDTNPKKFLDAREVI